MPLCHYAATPSLRRRVGRLVPKPASPLERPRIAVRPSFPRSSPVAVAAAVATRFFSACLDFDMPYAVMDRFDNGIWSNVGEASRTYRIVPICKPRSFDVHGQVLYYSTLRTGKIGASKVRRACWANHVLIARYWMTKHHLSCARGDRRRCFFLGWLERWTGTRLAASLLPCVPACLRPCRVSLDLKAC